MVSWTKGEEGEERRGGGGRQKAGRDGNCFDATRGRKRKRREGPQGKCKNRGRHLRRAHYAGAYLVWSEWHGKVGMGWQLRWGIEVWGTRYFILGGNSHWL